MVFIHLSKIFASFPAVAVFMPDNSKLENGFQYIEWNNQYLQRLSSVTIITNLWPKQRQIRRHRKWTLIDLLFIYLYEYLYMQ